jgi:GxxExxY protein
VSEGHGTSASGTREPDEATDLLARGVIGAAIEVHRHLGPGFLEGVYREALGVELGLRGIPFQRERRVLVDYKGFVVGEGFIDLLVGDRVVVELKAVKALAPIHDAQAISYLKAAELELALLINFHERLLRDGIRRVIRTQAA